MKKLKWCSLPLPFLGLKYSILCFAFMPASNSQLLIEPTTYQVEVLDTPDTFKTKVFLLAQLCELGAYNCAFLCDISFLPLLCFALPLVSTWQ